MCRIRRWIYLLLLPLVFFGGCTASIPHTWSWAERFWVRDADADEKLFPVLVLDSAGKYSAEAFDEVRADRSIVLGDFDEAAINRDLNQSIGGTGAYPFFSVISKTPTATTVSLEMPTLHESKYKAWYEISRGTIRPTRVLSYGPGFAFVVIACNVAVGLLSVAVFRFVFRPKVMAAGDSSLRSE